MEEKNMELRYKFKKNKKIFLKRAKIHEKRAKVKKTEIERRMQVIQ